MSLIEVSDLSKRLPARFGAALQTVEASHIGIGVWDSGGATGRSTARAVLLVSRRSVSLEPFPRDVDRGATTTLRGRLLDGLAMPQVVVTGPDGLPQPAPLTGGQGPSFETPLSFTSKGRYLVEVLGTGQRGPEVAALLVVSAGGAAVSAPERPAPGPDPAGAEAAEDRVVAAVNALREGRGLPALEKHDRLREVARRHSADMLAQGIVAHVLPGGLPVSARLQRDRVPYRSARENLAKGESAMDAHLSIEDSPAHLASLLDPVATHIGVGIARGRLPGGQTVVYLSEVLVQRVDDASDGNLRPETRVKEALWKERERLGRPPLLADPALDALALRGAHEMLQRDALDLGSYTDQALALPRRVVAADAFVVSSPVNAARSPNLADAQFRRVGVGVAIGDSPTRGAGMLWVAVIYTD